MIKEVSNPTGGGLNGNEVPLSPTLTYKMDHDKVKFVLFTGQAGHYARNIHTIQV